MSSLDINACVPHRKELNPKAPRQLWTDRPRIGARRSHEDHCARPESFERYVKFHLKKATTSSAGRKSRQSGKIIAVLVKNRVVVGMPADELQITSQEPAAPEWHHRRSAKAASHISI